uniref:Uncharacterized protein n=1 Tax=Arundo donax TaxID=35708 RepID=A0A0A8ZUH0_ARUDO
MAPGPESIFAVETRTLRLMAASVVCLYFENEMTYSVVHKGYPVWDTLTFRVQIHQDEIHH